MSSWIKADFRFPQRAAILVIGLRDAEDVFEIVKRHADTPDDLERCLREIIERHRPDLTGAILWHMSFSPPRMAWEVFIEHPSLPAKQIGQMATEIPLHLEDAGGEWFNAERNLWLADTKTVADVPLTVN